MKNFLKIWIVAFAGISIVLLYHCIDIFILGHEDSKLGDVGTLIFYILFYSVLGVINATVFGLIYYFNTKEEPSRKILLYTFLFNALLQIVAMPISFVVGFGIVIISFGFSMFISVAMHESI